MRYQDPELQDRLAAEYVMGALTSRAKKRFEKLMLLYPGYGHRVDAWAERLQALNEAIEPVSPPAHVWETIVKKITPPNAVEKPLFLLPSLVPAMAALLVLVLGFYWYIADEANQPRVIVKNEKQQTEWIIEVRPKTGKILVQTITPPVLPKDKVCVLWLAWQDGLEQLVGVLSDKTGESELDFPRNNGNLIQAAQVLVSVEEKGQMQLRPTGKIVFSGRWRGF